MESDIQGWLRRRGRYRRHESNEFPYVIPGGIGIRFSHREPLVGMATAVTASDGLSTVASGSVQFLRWLAGITGRWTLRTRFGVVII